jgi:cell shape-determining protein MreD
LQVRIFVLAIAVIIQFLMELTAGRVFVAPSIVPFVLVYLSENYEKMWAINGAFWSGFCLDLLMHQPPGSSSLALLAGLYAAKAFSKFLSGEGKGYLLSMTVIAVLVSDTVFILVATRPLGSGFNSVLFLVIPRVVLSVIIGALLLTVTELISDMRSRKVTG